MKKQVEKSLLKGYIKANMKTEIPALFNREIAFRLRLEGKTLKKISEELDVPFGTVNRWHYGDTWKKKADKIRARIHKQTELEIERLLRENHPKFVETQIGLAQQLADKALRHVQSELADSKTGYLKEAAQSAKISSDLGAKLYGDNHHERPQSTMVVSAERMNMEIRPIKSTPEPIDVTPED